MGWSRWVRRVVVVAALLVGGAVVNVAVVWGCVIFVKAGPTVAPAAIPDVPVTLHPEWEPSLTYQVSSSVGRRCEVWLNHTLGRYPGQTSRGGTVVVDSFGWPIVSLRRVELLTSIRKFEEWSGARRPGVVVPWLSGVRDPHRPIRFPVDIVPLAFAANTLFYAFLMAAPWLVWKLVRWVRRPRMGLCRACGYDVRGLAMCPECGLAVVRGTEAEVGA